MWRRFGFTSLLLFLILSAQGQVNAQGKDKKAATDLIRIGESPKPADLDPSELAAWTAIGNILLSLDETITKS